MNLTISVLGVNIKGLALSVPMLSWERMIRKIVQ
jgi:hypothetical protein